MPGGGVGPTSWGWPGGIEHPLLPGPGGMKTPYHLDGHENVDDPGAWQLWWEFNKDPYLRYARINTGTSETLGDAFFLGKGERARRHGGRASAETVEKQIVPHLLSAVQKGGTNELVRGCLLALAKIGGEESAPRIEYVVRWFLSGDNGNQLMNFSAPVALGVLAGSDGIDVLAGLAKDDAVGREVYGRKVNDSMRAFAAYGLGLVGSNSPDMELRHRIVRDLVHCLEDDETATTDLKVAALTAMGLVPLPVVEDDMVCYCGKCEVPNPDTSLGSQVTYLLRYFTAEREFDPVVRAHTATTLGRLIEAQPEGMSQRLKEVVSEFLIGALHKQRKQPVEVKASAVLALGLVGDADEDEVDGWIRWALTRAAGHGDALERRFAMVSLAQVGARRGQGEEPFAATPEVRSELMRHLSRAKNDVRPWAGLALGVLGARLSDSGGQLDPAVDAALRNSLQRARGADELGAYALAVGLRGDREASDDLVRELERAREESARSYVALGLGLLGAREAIEPLQQALEDASDAPLLATRAGVALGLLGDVTVVDALLETLAETEDDQVRCATARALGYIGDERSVEALSKLLLDTRSSDDVRESAAVALGFTADRAALPWRTRIASGVNYLAKSDTLTCSDGSGILDIE